MPVCNCFVKALWLALTPEGAAWLAASAGAARRNGFYHPALGLHDLHAVSPSILRAGAGFRDVLQVLEDQAVERLRTVEPEAVAELAVEFAQQACRLRPRRAVSWRWKCAGCSGEWVVNSPMISSTMSSSVTRPMSSPYSSTTSARRSLVLLEVLQLREQRRARRDEIRLAQHLAQRPPRRSRRRRAARSTLRSVQHADDVVRRVLRIPAGACGSRWRAAGAMASGVVVEVDRLDLAARRHHVVHRDALEVEQVEQDRLVLPRHELPASSTSVRISSGVELACSRRSCRVEPEEPQQRLHEEVDEPDDRDSSALSSGVEHVAPAAARCARRRRRRSTFGVISEKTRIRNVTSDACRRRARSRSRRTGARVITPTASRPPALTGCCRAGSRRAACRCRASSAIASLRAAIARARQVLQPIAVHRHHAVSAIEKNAEITSSDGRARRTAKRARGGCLSKSSVAASRAEEHFEHELAAEVAEHAAARMPARIQRSAVRPRQP